jgi:valyl-tRNA synthetase
LLLVEDLEKNGKKILDFKKLENKKLSKEDKEILDNLKTVIGKVNKALEKYRFSEASDEIYQFMWREVADKYIEQVKGREDRDVALAVLKHVLDTGLRLLHPFMPFVTEAIWENLGADIKENIDKKALVEENWPTI